MRNSKQPPGNHRQLSKSSTSIPLAAALVAIVLTFFNFLAGATRNIAQAVVPEPRLALAGGSPIREPDSAPLPRNSGMMNNATVGGRYARRGTRHAAGQFGGGGRNHN